MNLYLTVDSYNTFSDNVAT